MSALSQAVTDYLTMRRALGYKLGKTERLLGQYVIFVEDRGEAAPRFFSLFVAAARFDRLKLARDC